MDNLKERYDLDVHSEVKTSCASCKAFEEFGNKCWYFWERKKECSQKR